MGFWDKILPGYKGYREREESRNTDKALRDYLAGRLRRARDGWEEVKLELSRKPGALELLGIADRGTGKLARVIERLAHANYGISGNWFGPGVDARLLERLRAHDELLANEVARIEAAVSELGRADEEALPAASRELERRIGELDGKLDERETILRTLDGAALERA